jgi:hypothetical protein
MKMITVLLLASFCAFLMGVVNLLKPKEATWEEEEPEAPNLFL